MMRAKFAGAFVAIFVPTMVAAETVTLRCSELNKPKGQALEFSVAINTDTRRVLDIGYGADVETDTFSETTISARHRLSIGPMIVTLDIDRVSGKFDLKWLIFGDNKKLDTKATKFFEGRCEALRRKL